MCVLNIYMLSALRCIHKVLHASAFWATRAKAAEAAAKARLSCPGKPHLNGEETKSIELVALSRTQEGINSNGNIIDI